MAVTTLSDTQVRALGVTPIQLVPSPGPGKIILPTAMAMYVPGASTYAASLSFYMAGTDLYDWGSALSPGTSYVSPAGNFFQAQGEIFGTFRLDRATPHCEVSFRDGHWRWNSDYGLVFSVGHSMRVLAHYKIRQTRYKRRIEDYLGGRSTLAA